MSESPHTGVRIAFPPLQEGGVSPVWNGETFDIDGMSFETLSYLTSESGWDPKIADLLVDEAAKESVMGAASRRHTVMQMRQQLKLPSPHLLEVGCTSGDLLHDLQQAFPHAALVGSDYLSESILRLRQRISDIPLLQMDITNCPFPDDHFDAIAVLNVLEHIPDDVSAMRHMYRILKPGGTIVIEVPAGPGLYDIFDRTAGHYRRYTMRSIRKLALDTGFNIQFASHMGFFIYPAFWLKKKLSRRKHGQFGNTDYVAVASQLRTANRSNVLRAMLRLEERFRKKIYFPFGIRCLLTCQKPVTGQSE